MALTVERSPVRLRKTLPKVAPVLEKTEEDLLAFYSFPSDHWPKLSCTNPLERVNREIGRRTDVRRHLPPNNRALIRLAASVVIEENGEWLVGRRYLSAHSRETVLDQQQEEEERREETRKLTTA
jgi:transposase-like protein